MTSTLFDNVIVDLILNGERRRGAEPIEGDISPVSGRKELGHLIV